MNKAILLVNVGTPDSPTREDVRKFLSEFLNDPFVIDLPYLIRKALVNLIIIPFRVSKSTRLYQELWTINGSPLLVHLNKLRHKLQIEANGEFDVFGSMRYGNPSIESQLELMKASGYKELVIFPLYPHYATSTTETVVKHVNQVLRNLDYSPEILFVDQFYNHPSFINGFLENILKHDLGTYDHVVFSYHGLPVRQVEKLHKDFSYRSCKCDAAMPTHGEKCYRATCYETSRILADSLNLDEDDYSVGFQSRLSRNWLEPFTDQLLNKLLNSGKKKILVIAPSFVSDCLETIIEIGVEYKEDFIRRGGEKLQLVESLNSSETWAKAILHIIKDYKKLA